MMARHVVILRPNDNSSELSTAIRDRGMEPIIEPILSIQYLQADYSGVEPDSPLIFTSANAVKAFAAVNSTRDHPIYTVGRNTADIARSSGFQNIESALGTVDDLVELFTNTLKTTQNAPVYVRGDDISADLSGIFAKKGLNIVEITAYKAHPAENLSINLLKAADKGQISGIMFFSARGARTFAALAEQYGRQRAMKAIKALCISDAVVDCLTGLPFQEVVVAVQPNRYGMIQLLDRLS